jgi:hypothetical protein
MEENITNPELLFKVVKSMNMKAKFYAEVLNKVETCEDDLELVKWLRQYISVHKESIEKGEPLIWD